MTEKEKMIRGEMYDPSDMELLSDRKNARRLTQQINVLPVDQEEEREALFRRLLGGVGENFAIEPPFYCDYGYNIILGEDVFINIGCVILDVAPVVIGKNVMIATNVQLLTATHPLDVKGRNSGKEFAKPIRIGDNVWIGGGVIVNPGVTIGENAVIGSGSVVVSDIPANMLAVGNPCRQRKFINQEE